MHERKALMLELSDGFIVLPGGTGTLEEFFEALTWVQLGVDRKPCGLLDVGGYYGPLLAVLDYMVSEGFLSGGTGPWSSSRRSLYGYSRPSRNIGHRGRSSSGSTGRRRDGLRGTPIGTHPQVVVS
jgi:hypothetical protein